MQTPRNLFKQALADGPAQIGLWIALVSAYSTELLAGKAPGILATSEPVARQWLAAGARFVAVGADTLLLDSAARALLARYRTS